MRLRRKRPAKCAKTTRLWSSCTLNKPLGNFSNTTPVTSMLSSLLIQSLLANRRDNSSPVHAFPVAGSARHCYVGCLQSLGPLGNLEFDSRAFFQAAISVRLNGGEMNENV